MQLLNIVKAVRHTAVYSKQGRQTWSQYAQAFVIHDKYNNWKQSDKWLVRVSQM